VSRPRSFISPSKNVAHVQQDLTNYKIKIIDNSPHAQKFAKFMLTNCSQIQNWQISYNDIQSVHSEVQNNELQTTKLCYLHIITVKLIVSQGNGG